MCQKENGLYKRIFARSLAGSDLAQDQIYGSFKKELFADLTGDVLELGAGTGLNLPFIPAGAKWTGVEPNPYMHRHIYEKAAMLGREVVVRQEKAESMSLPDNCMDAVISTLVLCSVADPSAVLREVVRILKPGGRFLFIEHVAATPGTGLRKVQRAIRPIWKWVADGCTPDRETYRFIESSAFSSIDVRHFEAPVPFTIRIIKPHIMGCAVK